MKKSDPVVEEVRAARDAIVAKNAPRSGWAEAARKLHAEGGDKLLDAPTPTRFDETDWQWSLHLGRSSPAAIAHVIAALQEMFTP